jgi:hypothetical protein
MIVAFDPGTKAVGVAVFSDEGELLVAYLVRGIGPLDVTSRVNATGKYVFVEYPRVYPAGKGKGDPNDLVEVALVSGGLGARAARLDSTVRLVCAPEWTRVPKDIQNARTLAALTDSEKSRIEACPSSLKHNVIDAIGLGLWGLTTLGIRRKDNGCPSKPFSKSSPKKFASKRAKKS